MNLHLDTIKPSDYQRFYEWFGDEKFLETYDYVFPKPMTKAEVDKMLKDYETNEESVALAIRLENGKAIGIAGYIDIDKDNKVATLFIGIGDTEEQGKGYGKIALQKLIDYGECTLKLYKIQLKVLEFNHRAIELYEGAGFQKEGVQRKYCLRDNRRFDLLMYGKIL